MRTGPRDPRWLTVFCIVNVVGLNVAVASLTWVNEVLLPEASATLWSDIEVLAATDLAFVVSLIMLRRGLVEPAVMLMTLMSWFVAVSTTWLSPFLMPLNVMVAIGPVMVFSALMSRRVVRVAIGGAVVAVAMVAVVAVLPGAEARDAYQVWVRGPVLCAFVPLIAAAIAVGIWSNYAYLLDQAEQIQASRARLVTAVDDARRRLERDLHDGAQQRLVAATVHLGLVARLVKRDPDAAAAAIQELVGELHAAVAEVRTLAQGLYPPALAELGLRSALAAAARRSVVPVDLEIDDDLGRYPAETEVAVYFCCLEAVTNAAKHSGAGRIRVRVEAGPPLRFEVEDDGEGFDVSEAVAGMGLTTMADRIGSLGGELTVTSERGGGTLVEGVVPW